MKRRISPRKQAGGLLTASPFLLPSLIGMLIFSVLPLIISGMISLTDWNGLAKLTGPGFLQEHFIGLENYKKILTSTEFWRTLGNTAEYIVLYIPLMLAASMEYRGRYIPCLARRGGESAFSGSYTISPCLPAGLPLP